jgi:hypothetical protein
MHISYKMPLSGIDPVPTPRFVPSRQLRPTQGAFRSAPLLPILPPLTPSHPSIHGYIWTVAWIRPGTPLALATLPLSSTYLVKAGLPLMPPGLLTRSQDVRIPILPGTWASSFLRGDPYVSFYLGKGYDPLSFKALNRGSPIVKPTKGTGGV